jgi:hypothetical protein
MKIVTPAMKELIKEEKEHGFKKQNYYYNNKNYYGRKNSFNKYSHNFNSSTYQLTQDIQKISNNNQFFRKGGEDHGQLLSKPEVVISLLNTIFFLLSLSYIDFVFPISC